VCIQMSDVLITGVGARREQELRQGGARLRQRSGEEGGGGWDGKLGWEVGKLAGG
jgi:hypothetical protein